MNWFMMFMVFMYTGGFMLDLAMDKSTGISATVLAAKLEVADTSMSVHSTANFLTLDVLFIGDERICYTGKTATTFTGLTRGCKGDKKYTASAHPAGDRVYNEAAGVINRIVGFNSLTAITTGGVIQKFQGVSHLIGGFVSAIVRMVMWDFGYLEGAVVYFKYLFLYPLSAGFVVSTVLFARRLLPF